MRIETFGNPNTSAIVILPGMFCTAQSVRLFAEKMQTEGFYVLPTFSGHYADGPDYESKESEAAAILRWLEEHGVQHIALLHGTSMGAEVAMELLRQMQGRMMVDHMFFDGGPFFHFPWLFRRVMEGKFRQMAELKQYNSAEEALGALSEIPLLKNIVGKNGSKYLPMIRTMLLEKHAITPATIRNVTETCYTFDMPRFDEETQRRMYFLYSDDEPAHMAKNRVQKAYPHAQFRDVHGLGHCGWQTCDAIGYAAMLDDYIA